MIASLVRVFGDIDLAEDAVQEAFLAATLKWRMHGVPPNPRGWIMVAARNKALDRRESSRNDRQRQAAVLGSPSPDAEFDELPDDRLRLIFTRCHPALSTQAQVALTLRLLCGLRTPEIARAFLVPEATMAQRLVRAKRKISDAGIPSRIPRSFELAARLEPTLAVVYLIFNEGYTASHGDALIRTELCDEGIRLSRLLVGLLPDEPEVLGLLALLLLIEARRSARTNAKGALVLLADQDRSLWNNAMIAEGQGVVRACLVKGHPGPYQLQAAINAVHCDAKRTGTTDWRQIVRLYDHLLAFIPTPVVELNRYVTLAEIEGPDSVLGQVENLTLDGYYPFHATRADLLRRLGRVEDARTEYSAALSLCENEVERDFLSRRLAAL